MKKLFLYLNYLALGLLFIIIILGTTKNEIEKSLIFNTIVLSFDILFIITCIYNIIFCHKNYDKVLKYLFCFLLTLFLVAFVTVLLKIRISMIILYSYDLLAYSVYLTFIIKNNKVLKS